MKNSEDIDALVRERSPQMRKIMKRNIFRRFIGGIGEGIVTIVDTIAKPFSDIDEYMHDSLDRARLTLQSDPTKRSLTNRMKQLGGYLLNITAFIGTQCVNLIRKPLALGANIIKATGVMLGMLGNSDSSKCNMDALKSTFIEMGNNIKDTVIAGVTIVVAAVATYVVALPATGAVAGLGVAGTAAIFISKALYTAPIATKTAVDISSIAISGVRGVDALKRGVDLNINSPTRFDRDSDDFKAMEEAYKKMKDLTLPTEVRKEHRERMHQSHQRLKQESWRRFLGSKDSVQDTHEKDIIRS